MRQEPQQPEVPAHDDGTIASSRGTGQWVATQHNACATILFSLFVVVEDYGSSVDAAASILYLGRAHRVERIRIDVCHFPWVCDSVLILPSLGEVSDPFCGYIVALFQDFEVAYMDP